jgi:hypothetical protein
LVKADTAYRERIAQDGSFAIPIVKPDGSNGHIAKHEVYLLSSKGKTIDSSEKKVVLNLS